MLAEHTGFYVCVFSVSQKKSDVAARTRYSRCSERHGIAGGGGTEVVGHTAHCSWLLHLAARHHHYYRRYRTLLQVSVIIRKLP